MDSQLCFFKGRSHPRSEDKYITMFRNKDNTLVPTSKAKYNFCPNTKEEIKVRRFLCIGFMIIFAEINKNEYVI